MEFALFLMVNAAMFLRPGEIVPALAGVPIYQILILACLAASAPKLAKQWTSVPLSDRPVSLCVVGLLAAVILSHLAHSNLPFAAWWGIEFGKVVLYVLLLVAVVDTPSRLRRFMLCQLALIFLMASISLMQYHRLIDVPALKVLERNEVDKETGEDIIILQMVGTGIFNDPNDLCLILSSGVLIGLFFLNDRRLGLARALFLVPVATLGYALTRTQSRGGLLALLAGLAILAADRLGTRRAIVLAAAAVPLVGTVLGGRFASMSASEGTAQDRIRLWRESMILFRQSPAFGIGANALEGEIGLVAHNSFVHSYAETGFLGGTLLVSAFVLSARSLRGLNRRPAETVAPELRRAGPYLLAILASLFVGLCSLSRNYVVSTYGPLGMAEVYRRVATAGRPGLAGGLGGRDLILALSVSVACILSIATFVFVMAS